MRNILDGQLSMVEKIDTVKELKKSYTCILKERIEENDIDSLVDEEVLSLLTGISIDIVKKAINDFGMIDLFKYLNSIDITKTQRQKLELLSNYHRRMSTAIHKDKPILNSSSKAGEFAKSLFIGKSYECFYLICLDAQNRVNYASLVHKGTINEAPVYPRVNCRDSP